MTYQWRILPAKQFNEIANEWDNLNHQTFNSPILESRFVEPAINLFGDNNEVIAICSCETAIIAMGVFKKYKFGCWSTFQPSQAPIGLWICQPDIDIEQALQSLTNNLPGICLLVSILQLDVNLIPKPTNSLKLANLDYIETARISVNSGHDTYYTSRSKNTKKAIRKQHNKLDDRGLKTKLEVIIDSNEIANAIKQYGELESAGWKSANNTAISAENTQGLFYTGMIKTFCQTGNGIIFKYWIGDQIAAMDLCISNQDSIVILKTTYDESLGEYSPALLMHNELFKYIFENTQYKTIEFYGKVMDWHKKWSDDFRDIYHVNFYKSGLIKNLKN